MGFYEIPDQGLVPGGHGIVDTCLQVSQVVWRADDPLTDLLEDLGNIGIAGRLVLDKAWFETLVCPLEKDPLDDDDMIMDIELQCATEALEKRHRSRETFCRATLRLTAWLGIK